VERIKELENIPLVLKSGVRMKSIIRVTLVMRDTTVEQTVIQKASPYVNPSLNRWVTPKTVTATMLIISIVHVNTALCSKHEHEPWMDKNSIHESVIVVTRFSRNLMMMHILAIIAQAMLIPRPTSNIAGLGRVSTTVDPWVRIYQYPVSPGISSKIENGITMPDMRGVFR